MKVRTSLLSTLFSAVLFAAPGISQTVWYVDDDATPGGDGLSWASAHKDLQSALDVVGTGDQIWVATGRYRPTHLLTPGDGRSAAFKIPIEVRIYGGFAGHEPSVSERAGLFDRTELSGDLGVKGVDTDNA